MRSYSDEKRKKEVDEQLFRAQLSYRSLRIFALIVLGCLLIASFAIAKTYAEGTPPIKGSSVEVTSSAKSVVSNPGSVLQAKRRFVEVESGDSLWSIARKYKSDDENIQPYIFRLKSMNHLKSSMIKIGQIIFLPE